jgi:NAD(P)-dependent dehydrogenase (short-subunit alcohol dehydrogenase family)
MTSLRGKKALVVGAGAGVGRATARALAREGSLVTAIARGAEGLEALRSEVPEGLSTVRADASDPATASRLLGELRPELVVLSGGVRPRMGPVDELDWDAFSEAWNNDMKSAFLFTKAALTVPLAPGSTVVVLSSGAAIAGSHYSGGYAGAKRMQWLLAGYAQQRSEAKSLGIRFLALVPKQLIEGTAIGEHASSTYGALSGKTGADYMKRFDVPLDSDKVAAAVLKGLRGEIEKSVIAMAVTGTGVEPLG